MSPTPGPFDLRHVHARLAVLVQSRADAPARRSERGDVPGWVLVTLMSAILVAALIAASQTLLGETFKNAINSISDGLEGAG